MSTDDFKEFDQAFITMIRLLNAIPLVIKSSKTALKRALLKTLFSNFYLNDGKLSYALVTPLPTMLRIDEERKWLCLLDTIRTYHRQELTSMIQNIPDDLRSFIEPS